MNIAVYCGASPGQDPAYLKSAHEIGRWIATNNNDLVYGGGNVGLMGQLADTVLENGGQVIGVMPEFLAKRELAHTQLTELITVADMHQRKMKMIQLADCFIALPGGPGTLEEISEVVSWGRIGQHQNPCIFYNVNGFYELLKTFYQQMVTTGFLTQADYDNLLFSDSLPEIEEFIAHFKASEIRKYH